MTTTKQGRSKLSFTAALFFFMFSVSISMLPGCSSFGDKWMTIDKSGHSQPIQDGNEPPDLAGFTKKRDPKGQWTSLRKLDNGEILELCPGYILDLNSPLYAVKKDNKLGFVDRSGNLVVSTIYRHVNWFGLDSCTVQDADGSWLVLDTKGSVISKLPLPPDFKPTNYPPTPEGIVDLTKVDYGAHGIYNIRNKQLIILPFDYFVSFGFSEGYATCMTKGGHGFIDTAGKLAIYPKYRFVRNFHEGLAAVYDDKDGWAYIDKSGKKVITLPSDCCSAEDFHEGLAAIALGGHEDPKFHIPQLGTGLFVHASNARLGAKWAFINASGKIVIPAQYYVGSKYLESHYRLSSIVRSIPLTKPRFSEGLAAVASETNGNILYGYINNRGNWVIEPKFKTATDFHGGKARVCIGAGFAPAQTFSLEPVN